MALPLSGHVVVRQRREPRWVIVAPDGRRPEHAIGDEVRALRGVLGDRTQCERLGQRGRARVTQWSWETQALEYERILFGT